MNRTKKSIILSVLSSAAALTMSANAFAADLSGWAVSEYQSANMAGLCSYAVVSNNMTENITRQEFCELAVNLYKKLTNDYDLIVPENSPFTDTDNLAVKQAYCYGIVSGTDENTFTPDRLVTREEMAKMLVSTLTAGDASFTLSDGSDTSAIDSFRDAGQVSSWAKSSVITMLNYSLMNGVTNEYLKPTGATTREQAIASINRSYDKFGHDDYSLELPAITLPSDNAEIEAGPFEIKWTPTTNALNYTVIIKDQNGEAIIWTDTEDTSITIDAAWMEVNKDYSIIVGATLPDQSECFSVPVDFRYKANPKKSEYVAPNPKAQALIDTAAKYLGVPYVWGGSSPKGFDCSGFVQYVCKENGISIPRVADDQYRQAGQSVSKDKLQPGDLVFFGSGGYVTHVGMYVGNGTMIHAPSTGKNIMYTSINSDYYTKRYMGAKRVF